MAKLSSVNKNNRRIKLSDKYYKKRKNLKNQFQILKRGKILTQVLNLL